MAITATVDKFGITFTDAYHKISRLTYESYDHEQYAYAEQVDPAEPVVPTKEWVSKKVCHFEVEAYASEETREAHSEPIYRTHFNFEPSMSAEASDILVQAYEYLKAQAGYEDAVDC